MNNLFGFESPFANQYQPPANQCNIWFAETANEHVGQGTGLYVVVFYSRSKFTKKYNFLFFEISCN